jgi:hypothetical protein
MVTEKQLFGKKYSFKHIEIKVIEKNEKDNVLVFSASFVTTALPGRMSDGHIEINRTLWDQSSPKRPPGYWNLGSMEKDGVMTCYFAADEWIDNTPGDVQLAKQREWGIKK